MPRIRMDREAVEIVLLQSVSVKRQLTETETEIDLQEGQTTETGIGLQEGQTIETETVRRGIMTVREQNPALKRTIIVSAEILLW